jgi:hypothetical protein
MTGHMDYPDSRHHLGISINLGKVALWHECLRIRTKKDRMRISRKLKLCPLYNDLSISALWRIASVIKMKMGLYDNINIVRRDPNRIQGLLKSGYFFVFTIPEFLHYLRRST